MTLREEMTKAAASVDAALEEYLAVKDCPQKVVLEAMAYSAEAGGKRIRPFLTLAFCQLLGGSPADAMPFACALEMIHTYSLIHDDLPCMDDDALRRGKPSCHIAFGEAVALLAGDGLLTYAFETAGQANLPASQVVQGVVTLAQAAGTDGMIGGQVMDLAGEGKTMEEAVLLEMYEKKTGALLWAAARLGCIAAGADSLVFQAVDRYARAVGLAFQIQDDILDVIGDTAILGKPVGSDAQQQKSTYVAIHGLDAAHQEVARLTREAEQALAQLPGDTDLLAQLAQFLAGRKF